MVQRDRYYYLIPILTFFNKLFQLKSGFILQIVAIISTVGIYCWFNVWIVDFIASAAVFIIALGTGDVCTMSSKWGSNHKRYARVPQRLGSIMRYSGPNMLLVAAINIISSVICKFLL